MKFIAFRVSPDKLTTHSVANRDDLDGAAREKVAGIAVRRRRTEERDLGGRIGAEAVYNGPEGVMNLQQRRTEILQIAAHHGASNLRVFGSVARGDDSVGSDLDLLVDMEPERSFLDIVGLSQSLEELLERRLNLGPLLVAIDALLADQSRHSTPT